MNHNVCQIFAAILFGLAASVSGCVAETARDSEQPEVASENAALSGLPIDDHYSAWGPWESTDHLQDPSVPSRLLTIGICNGTSLCSGTSAPGLTHVVYYPQDVGLWGFHNPIVVWGNGSNAAAPNPPDQFVRAYDTLLRHLASWGFVVVAAATGNAWPGDTLLQGVACLVDQNSRAPSEVSPNPFYGKLDLSNIAALGHSQGAAAAVNAMNRSQSAGSGFAIKSAIPVAFPYDYPNQAGWVGWQGNTSVFFVGGEKDWLYSPPRPRRVDLQRIPAVEGVGYPWVGGPQRHQGQLPGPQSFGRMRNCWAGSAQGLHHGLADGPTAERRVCAQSVHQFYGRRGRSGAASEPGLESQGQSSISVSCVISVMGLCA
jgi:hypothetical protein